jgi:hypothetical protein
MYIGTVLKDISTVTVELEKQATVTCLLFKQVCTEVAKHLGIQCIRGWREVSILEALNEGTRLCLMIDEEEGTSDEWKSLFRVCYLELKSFEVQLRIHEIRTIENNIWTIRSDSTGDYYVNDTTKPIPCPYNQKDNFRIVDKMIKADQEDQDDLTTKPKTVASYYYPYNQKSNFEILDEMIEADQKENGKLAQEIYEFLLKTLSTQNTSKYSF